jgi:hypothetical protein
MKTDERRTELDRVTVFLRALLLFSVLCLCGCASRAISERLQWTTLRTIQVEGRVTWNGRLSGKYVELRAKAQPQTIAGSGDAILQVSVPSDQGSHNTIAYKWELDVDKRAKITREERVWGVPRNRSVRHETFSVREHILRVRPPEGWAVSPSQYRITKDRKHVDFVLTRERTNPK